LPRLWQQAPHVPIQSRMVMQIIAISHGSGWPSSLKDKQSALCLELVSGDDVRVAGREVDCCACDSSRDHRRFDAGGNEGRDCHDHALSVVAFLSEEDELAVVSVSHERCSCLHLPYLAGWHGDRDPSWQSGLLLLLFWRRWLFLLFLRWQQRHCEDGVDRASFLLFSLLNTRCTLMFAM
jgi:hypothetical protein